MPFKNPDALESIASARASRRKHYAANTAVYKKNAKERKLRLHRLTQQARQRPCMECGNSFPWWVMDFDHRPGEVKVANVSHLVKLGAAEARVLAEMAKCDIICSNCHRNRTFVRMGIDLGVDA